jgi:hypothetical protein
MPPRRFALVRHVDDTGISGVGVVAFGIAFSDGHVVLRWCSAHPATSSWNSLDDMLAVHAHDESTGIQWIDAPSTELADFPAAPGPGRRARREAALTGREPAPTPGIAIPDGPANGYPHPVPAADAPTGDPTLPPPRQPGRHRRAGQVEQSV